MSKKSEIKKTFEDIDDIDIKPSRKQKEEKSQVADTSNKIDVMALIEDKEEEERSEVMSIRITPSSRRKIEQIWLSQRKKRKKLKESTVAAEILMKVLDQY